MLCSSCRGFDIASLYELARNKVQNFPPKESKVGGFAEYKSVPKFHRLHDSLLSLQQGALAGCQLCASIWDQYAIEMPTDKRAVEQRLLEGESQGKIFLGLSNWSPEAHGAPYLKATQYHPHDDAVALRNLATFDVYVERGKSNCSQYL